MSATDTPSSYEPRYSTTGEIPVGGPDSPLGPDITGGGTTGEGYNLSSSALTARQKKAALHWAEHRVDRKINGGEELDLQTIPPDVIDAVNFYATYWLLVPSVHVASAQRGETTDDGSVRLQIAREYKAQGDEIVADLDDDEDVSGDEDNDRTHGGFVTTVTPGSNRE